MTETELFKLPYPDSTPAPPHIHRHYKLQPKHHAVSSA